MEKEQLFRFEIYPTEELKLNNHSLSETSCTVFKRIDFDTLMTIFANLDSQIYTSVITEEE